MNKESSAELAKEALYWIHEAGKPKDSADWDGNPVVVITFTPYVWGKVERLLETIAEQGNE